MEGSNETELKIRNIIVYLVPSLFSNLLPILTLPILTRFLSPKDFGIVTMAMSITLLVSLFACNVDAATQRYYFEYRKKHSDLCKLINTTLLFLLSAMIISLPFAYFSSGFFSKLVMGSSNYRWAIFTAYVSSWMSILVNFYLVLYRNMEKAKEFSFFTALQIIINSVLSLILIVFFKFTYMGMIYASLVSSSIVFAVLFRRFLIHFPFAYNRKMLLDNLKFGVPLLPNLFTSSIYQYFDKYLLSNLVSLNSVGIFSIAQSLSSKLFLFMTAVHQTYAPIFMKDMFDRGEEGASSVGRNFTVFTYISLSVILFAVLFGEEVIYIIAPVSYYSAINVFVILLVGISTQAFGKIIGSQLDYVKKAYLTFPITFIGLIINVGFNLLLIPWWGAEGAALASTLNIIVMNCFFVLIAQKFYKIIYEKRTLFYIYSIFFMSSGLLIALKTFESDIWLKYFVKILMLFFYFLVGVKAKIITKEKLAILFKFKKLMCIKTNC